MDVGQRPQDRRAWGGAKLPTMENTQPTDLYRRLQDMVRGAPQLMAALVAARQLGLASWCIGAGAVRTLVWDTLHGFEKPSVLEDIDVVFFEASPCHPAREAELERRLTALMPGPCWDVTNQATVHRLASRMPWAGGSSGAITRRGHIDMAGVRDLRRGVARGRRFSSYRGPAWTGGFVCASCQAQPRTRECSHLPAEGGAETVCAALAPGGGDSCGGIASDVPIGGKPVCALTGCLPTREVFRRCGRACRFNPRAYATARRLPMCWFPKPSSCFNPRADAGRDRERPSDGYHPHLVSTHAPTRGATCGGSPGTDTGTCFNPRAHAGRDLVSSEVSADTKRFQPTRPRGARRAGRDERKIGTRYSRCSFNPRAHAGRDAHIATIIREVFPFQPTRPRGARPKWRTSRPKADRFQPTRPRGARLAPIPDEAPGPSFNPRAHAGRDVSMAGTATTSCSFN